MRTLLNQFNAQDNARDAFASQSHGTITDRTHIRPRVSYRRKWQCQCRGSQTCRACCATNKHITSPGSSWGMMACQNAAKLHYLCQVWCTSCAHILCAHFADHDKPTSTSCRQMALQHTACAFAFDHKCTVHMVQSEQIHNEHMHHAHHFSRRGPLKPAGLWQRGNVALPTTVVRGLLVCYRQ
jgi:hypothetical protein